MGKHAAAQIPQGRILQQKNDYSREVFNGDLGVITTIDMEEQEVSAQFGDPCGICAAAREVTYDYADLNVNRWW